MSEAYRHSSRNIPVVLGGSAGGYFETGKLHRYGSFPAEHPTSTFAYQAHGGRTMNDLHLSLIHAMGFPEVETFGDPAFCTGALL